MSTPARIRVGVVVERKEIATAWADHVWRPSGVLVGAAPFDGWREMVRGQGWTRYYAGAFEVELHRRETTGYIHNLESGEPALYVVLRRNYGEPPVSVVLVTASPYETGAYTESGEEIVEPVPMPEELVPVVARFVEENHVEEPFRKRKRDKVDIEEHKFGQEPLVVLRRRMGEAPDG